MSKVKEAIKRIRDKQVVRGPLSSEDMRDSLDAYVTKLASELATKHNLDQDCAFSLVTELSDLASQEKELPPLRDAFDSEEKAAAWLQRAHELKFRSRVLESLLEVTEE